AGSILGGITAVRLMTALGPVRAVGVALATLAAGSLPFLIGNVALVLVGMVAAGVAIPWAFVAMATTRQKLTPNHLQGRTASATGVSLQLPQLISTGVGAAIVSVIDYRVLTVAAAGVIVAAAVWLLARGRSGDGESGGPAAGADPDTDAPVTLSGTAG
ncbi:MAG TPA: hypothetical protein VFM01_01845, partial [Nakamurella sp.]|nr:hypothetical protein [Nakamurella sp.]